MTHSKLNRLNLTKFFILFLCSFWFYTSNVNAEIVEKKLDNGLIATAEYLPGDPQKATVLVLHGFLTTRQFRTVNNLVNELADEDYTVLAPTLSLGVSRRKVTLSCDAIHTHSMEDDISEIQQWMKWLEQKKHQNIVFVGHSYGSLQGLVYAERSTKPALRKIIATSLIDAGQSDDNAITIDQIRAAKKLQKSNHPGLGEYRLSYCKKYVSPPKAFLSYVTWSKEKIVSALSKHNLPVHVILGGADKRMGKEWPQTLRKNGVEYTLMKGANHFFDAEYEFDLLDAVQEQLR